jgi:hypothetical protein
MGLYRRSRIHGQGSLVTKPTKQLKITQTLEEAAGTTTGCSYAEAA